jgi:pimeloyl-ACP methyl ester carboxylesterase
MEVESLMSRYILVPGACHGGWNLEPLADALRGHGHEAVAVTLTGLGPDPDAPGGINLDTHIEDVCRVLRSGGGPAILIGHSYAGSVITGVADLLPDQVAAMLYVDAFVPKDGDSCWTMTNDEQRSWYIDGAGRSGLGIDPLPFFDARARPHPVGSSCNDHA